MAYAEIVKSCEILSYRDKFRLAQFSIQIERKQEEEYPAPRKITGPDEQEKTSYFTERLLKLKPAKLATLPKFITAMFEFQDGTSESDKDAIVAKL